MSDNAYPESIQVTMDLARYLGMNYIADTFQHLWGNVGRLQTASEVWSFLSSEVITKGPDHGLKNAFNRRFTESDWSGEARTSYRLWLDEFRRQTVDPMAKRANEVSRILTDLIEIIRKVRGRLQVMAAEFLAAAGVGIYGKKKATGQHAKPPGGAHAKGNAQLKGAIALLFLLLVDLGRRLYDYYNDVRAEIGTLKGRVDRFGSDFPVGDRTRVAPSFPASAVADPRNWES